MEMLSLVGSYLGDTPNLRFEWSLKISGPEVMPRPEALFWITNYHGAHISGRYDKLHRLLRVLDCPIKIVDQARDLSAVSKAQGLMIPMNGCPDSSKLFIHYHDPFEQQEERLGLKWSSGHLPDKIVYLFRFFEDGDHQMLTAIVHPDLQNLVKALLTEPRLSTSGYYIQKKGTETKEIYITYPWHPALADVLPALQTCFPGKTADLLTGYAGHFYRQIGFTVWPDAQPVVTVYFSSGYKGCWPTDFETFREIVRVESFELNKKIKALNAS